MCLNDEGRARVAKGERESNKRRWERKKGQSGREEEEEEEGGGRTTMGVPVLSLNGGQGSAVQKSLAAAACVALAAAGKLKVVENIYVYVCIHRASTLLLYALNLCLNTSCHVQVKMYLLLG